MAKVFDLALRGYHSIRFDRTSKIGNGIPWRDGNKGVIHRLLGRKGSLLIFFCFVCFVLMRERALAGVCGVCMREKTGEMSI